MPENEELPRVWWQFVKATTDPKPMNPREHRDAGVIVPIVETRVRRGEDVTKAIPEGTVPKKVQVTRGGTTFEQTVYVSPGQKPEGETFTYEKLRDFKYKQERENAILPDSISKPDDELDEKDMKRIEDYSLKVGRALSAIDEYQWLSNDVNSALREGKELSGRIKRIVDGLEDAFTLSGYKSPADVVIYRGSPERFTDRDSFTDKGFSSLSVYSDSAHRFGHVISVLIPKGFPSIFTTTAEGEVILPRGTNFRKTGENEFTVISDNIDKAIPEGTVPKKVQVTRDGTTFEQTVYVKPEGEEPTDVSLHEYEGNITVHIKDKRAIAELSRISVNDLPDLNLPAGKWLWFNRLENATGEEGWGTKLLDKVLEYCQEKGYSILNQVSAYGKLSQKQLEDWYLSKGFKPLDYGRFKNGALIWKPEDVTKYEVLTDRPNPNPVGENTIPERVLHKAIATTGLIQQVLIQNILPRVNPEVGEHRHVGYDEPHPVDQTHWGEEAADVSLEGPFSVSGFLGQHPREMIHNYNKSHEHYFKLLQTYLDLANPEKDVTDNQLKIVAANLKPRTMKCVEDIRQRYLSADREIRDIEKIGGMKKDTEELELKRANAGKVFSVLDDVSGDLEDVEDRVQVAMALDKLISLEVSKPEGWYLAELFGIQNCEPMREATVRIMDGLRGQNKLELGFVGVHHIVTGDYLIKANSLIVTNDSTLYNGLKDKAFIIEKQAGKPIVIAGYASPVVRDKDGHRIPIQALRPAFKKFMSNPKFRNVMIKHRNAQVGEVVPEFIDTHGSKWVSQVDDIGLFVVCILRDDIKIARDVGGMIRQGLLRSFSIGGEALARKYVCEGHGNECWWDVTDLELHEVTICEEGKNQAAKFILLKSEDVWVENLDSLNLADLAPVISSGDEIGPELKLEDVLKYFRTFLRAKPIAFIVGGLANHGVTKGDIDILIKEAPRPIEERMAQEFRILRMFPPELRCRVQFSYDNYHGPFTNHVPLFDDAWVLTEEAKSGKVVKM
jgi:hypothetical protein